MRIRPILGVCSLFLIPLAWAGGASATPPAPSCTAGDFCPVSLGDGVAGHEQVVFRPEPDVDGSETWIAFVTRNPSPGHEAVRQIWLERNLCFPTPTPQPLLLDPAGVVSYLDPAWSPDGRFLAYVQTDASLSSGSIYIQEFVVSTDIAQAIVPVGAARLLVSGSPGVHHRHPAWRPDGLELAYDSDASGASIDLYTVPVDPPSVPTRRTFVDTKVEQTPAYDPSGSKLAYATNKYGPPVTEILDLPTGDVDLAEPGFAFVTHTGPRWSSDGRFLYYAAPKNESPLEQTRIWSLELATQAKHQIALDIPESGVDVSRHATMAADGRWYNSIAFSGQGGRPGAGLEAWRGVLCSAAVQPPELSASVDIDPNTINLQSHGRFVTAYVELPSGFGLETIDLSTVTLAGSVPPEPKFAHVGDHDQDGVPDLMLKFSRPSLAALLTPGVDPLTLSGTLTTGESFEGTDEVRVIDPQANQSAPVVPNPLNPSGSLAFSTTTPGPCTVRVYDMTGRLVRTLLETSSLPGGRHEVRIDDLGERGEKLPSGAYYVRIDTSEGNITGRFVILK